MCLTNFIYQTFQQYLQTIIGVAINRLKSAWNYLLLAELLTRLAFSRQFDQPVHNMFCSMKALPQLKCKEISDKRSGREVSSELWAQLEHPGTFKCNETLINSVCFAQTEYCVNGFFWFVRWDG